MRALRLFFRGFLLEALFHPGGKQRGGVSWILADRPERSPEEPFNTNPVLSGYAVGLIDQCSAAERRRLLGPLTAALGGIGDRLVWGLLRPLSVILSLLAAAAGPIPAAVTLLLVYNPPELALRWRSIRRGCLGFEEIQRDLAPNRLPRLAAWLARIAALAVGVLGGFWILDLCLAGRFVAVFSLIAGTAIGWIVLRRMRVGTWGVPACALFAAAVWLILGRMSR